MPEARLAKSRRSLPAGYQFGDARPAVRYDLPLCPILHETPNRIICVVLGDTEDHTVKAGLSELTDALYGGSFMAYAHLISPILASTRYFGPARLISMFNPFPSEGPPRVVHMLHLRE